jgi:hypothetical protein
VAEKVAASGPQLFNSPLETGIRALAILDAAYPRAFDLSELTWLDHLVVHTADIEGPASLHPDLPHRTGELLVRRHLIEEGLTLMRRQHLIEMQNDARGFLYKASDDGAAVLDLMRTDYTRTLRERARWLAKRIVAMGPGELKALVDEKIGRWSIEFNPSGPRPQPGTSAR